MPRPFPQRPPTIDELSPEGRVLHVHAALESARADLARLPEAEGALAELLAAQTIGESVDPGALDAAKLDAAHCQQARGLVAGLERRLVAALADAHAAEVATLTERSKAAEADVEHWQAAMDALQVQVQTVATSLQAAQVKHRTRIDERAAVLTQGARADWMLKRILGRNKPADVAA